VKKKYRDESRAALHYTRLERVTHMRARHATRLLAKFRSVRAPALAGLLGAALPACGSDGGEPTRVVAAEGDVATPEAEVPGTSAAPSAASGGFIDDEVEVGGGACASSVAAATFTSAVCSCEDTNVAGFLRTRSFRSSAGPNAPEEVGGSVGVNRDYITAGYADIGGSFTITGERDVGFGGYLEVGEDVRANPGLDIAGVLDVGRDAFLESDAFVLGRVGIGRDLTLEAGANIGGIAFVDVGGQRRTEAVDIAPPCGCAPEQVIDVAALVDAAETDNDNADRGLEPDDFNVVVGIGAEASLSHGRYFIHQLGGVGSLTLHVSGKVALFVADDLIATGLFRVELEPDAELDVFVRDNMLVTGAALFGDPARPSATRIYVGGTGDIAIAGAGAFVGNLYAPSANILIGGFGKVYGSLFGKNINAAGFLDLGYDTSITELSESCPPVEDGALPTIR
jgi:hypothetical protein